MASAVPGYFGSVVHTPAGFRLLHGGWPTITDLIWADSSGVPLWTEHFAEAGALNYLRAAASPTGVVAWIAQGTRREGAHDVDFAVIGEIVNDTSTQIQITDWPAFGQSGVNVAWVDHGFVFYGLIDGFHYYQVVGDERSAPMRNPFEKGSSQGWVSCWDGDLRWIDQVRDDPAQQLRFPSTRAGVTFGQNAYNTSGDYAAGLAPNGARFMAAPVLWQEPTIATNPAGDQWAVCGRQLHGQIGVATLPPFPPVDLTLVAPPVVPAPASAFRRRTAPQALIIDGAPDAKWMAAYNWPGDDAAIDANTHPVLGVVHKVHPAEAPEFDRHIHLARLFGKGLGLYVDSGAPSPSDWREVLQWLRERDPTLPWYPMGQFYIGRGESLEAYRSRISDVRDCLRLVAALGPNRYGGYVRAFTGEDSPDGAVDEQRVVDAMVVTHDVLVDDPWARRLLAFTWSRGAADGVRHTPSFNTTLRHWEAALPNPNDWGADVPAVPAAPPPPDEPGEPPPPPPEPSMPPPTDRPHATVSLDHIAPGEILYPDTYVRSATDRHRAYHQSDGQLVLLAMAPDGTSTPLWSSNVTDPDGLRYILQYEGNLVAYDVRDQDRWASPIHAPNSYVRLTDAPRLELVAPDGSIWPIWPPAEAPEPAPVVVPPEPQPDMPTYPYPGGPSPTHRPAPVIEGIGGSEYGIFVNPAIDRQGMADAYNALELRHTRVNLMNAWAWRKHPDYPGTVDGLIPLVRPALDAPWDLEAWNERYFEALPAFIDEQNAAGCVPVLTALENYSWNRFRKPTNVGQHLLPFHHNINGVDWLDSEAAEQDGTAALYFIAKPGDWMSEFLRRVVQAASSRGGVFGIEPFNEGPEKPLHGRIFDRCREAGFTGPVQVNRHEDKPSQYANMMGDRPYDYIAFHGRARMSDLREAHEENADRPTTFINMFEHRYDGPAYDFSKIVFSSDGCRRSGRPVEATYDWDDLAEVFRYVLSHGCPVEHQMVTKMRWVYDGRIDVADVLNIDGPFLRRLRA